MNFNVYNSKISLHMKHLLWLGHQHMLLQFTQQIRTFTQQTFLHERNSTNASHCTYCSRTITVTQSTVNCTECPLSSLPWACQLSHDVLTGTVFFKLLYIGMPHKKHSVVCSMCHIQHIISFLMYAGKSKYVVEDYMSEGWGIHCEDYEDCCLLEWWHIVLKVCTNLKIKPEVFFEILLPV